MLLELQPNIAVIGTNEVAEYAEKIGPLLTKITLPVADLYKVNTNS